ncbi:MAG: DUF5680 domain-containing protein, partial [Minisyncoccia bacterium]
MQLIDQWCDTGGRTLITFDNVPFWVMRYQGHYLNEAIPVLKAALASQYQARQFCWGRGPEIWCVSSGFRYLNRWRGSFSKFSGQELIHITEKNECGVDSIGGHEYWG